MQKQMFSSYNNKFYHNYFRPRKNIRPVRGKCDIHRHDNEILDSSSSTTKRTEPTKAETWVPNGTEWNRWQGESRQTFDSSPKQTRELFIVPVKVVQHKVKSKHSDAVCHSNTNPMIGEPNHYFRRHKNRRHEEILQPFWGKCDIHRHDKEQKQKTQVPNGTEQNVRDDKVSPGK
jgi:hypothetical protein